MKRIYVLFLFIANYCSAQTFSLADNTSTQGQELQQETNLTGLVSEIEGENISITVYPNPASNIIALNYKAIKPGTVTVNLYDILGRSTGKEAKENVTTTGDWKTIKFNLATLPSGIYFVKIDFASNSKVRSYTQKISVIK